MSELHIDKLGIYCNGKKVGELSQGERKQIWFQYDPKWISDGFDLSPKSLNFDLKPQLAKGSEFEGLHGVFADSLPDGWGLLLMDREFKRRFNWSPYEITPIDRLAYIGSRAMGALEYKPIYEQEPIPSEVDLRTLSQSVDAVLLGQESDILQQLIIQGGSPGGARPKVTIARSRTTSICMSGFQELSGDYAHWIVKFRSKEDPIDMGKIEYTYSKIAKLAGVEMPNTEIISITKGKNREDYFAVERFDRYNQNNKRHTISLAGLLYANYRTPCMDYDGVLTAVRGLTKNQGQIERAFRLMVFNILAHNKDDHVKNFAFTWNANDEWKLSPAFDLTFSTGMSGEHTTAINGQGNPSIKHVLAIAQKHQIKNAREIIKQVQNATKQWEKFATEYDVTHKSISFIQKEIDETNKIFNQN